MVVAGGVGVSKGGGRDLENERKGAGATGRHIWRTPEQRIAKLEPARVVPALRMVGDICGDAQGKARRQKKRRALETVWWGRGRSLNDE